MTNHADDELLEHKASFEEAFHELNDHEGESAVRAMAGALRAMVALPATSLVGVLAKLDVASNFGTIEFMRPANEMLVASAAIDLRRIMGPEKVVNQENADLLQFVSDDEHFVQRHDQEEAATWEEVVD